MSVVNVLYAQHLITNQTHDLTKSLRYDIQGHTLEFGGGNDRVNYAGHLELLKNRPNFVKSFRQKEDVIRMIFNKEIRRELERPSAPPVIVYSPFKPAIVRMFLCDIKSTSVELVENCRDTAIQTMANPDLGNYCIVYLDDASRISRPDPKQNFFLQKYSTN
jgi:hypothetical protein